MALFIVGCLPGGESNSSEADVVNPAATLSGNTGSESGVGMSGNAGGAAMMASAPEPPAKCERRGLMNADVSVKRVKNGLEYKAEIEGDGGKVKMVVTVYQSQDFIGPTSPGAYTE